MMLHVHTKNKGSRPSLEIITCDHITHVRTRIKGMTLLYQTRYLCYKVTAVISSLADR